MKKRSLLEVLEGIEDGRRERSVWYPLQEVLFILLVAVICGATSYVIVEMFGKSKEKRLKKYIKLENGVPDVCTFRKARHLESWPAQNPTELSNNPINQSCYAGFGLY